MSEQLEPNKSSSSDQVLGVWCYLPRSFHPFIFLARIDRPIGWWLLVLPGWWIAAAQSPTLDDALWLMGLFTIGAIAMRGAGCIVNDLWDRRLDAKITRTASRPLASGEISPRQALIFLACLSSVGFFILLQLPQRSWFVALGSFPLIICYPLAKRVTGWPQLVLGLTFSWAALVAASVISRDWLTIPLISVYLGTAMWVAGYDTIYAIQDRDDDRLAGVKSSALSLGRHIRIGMWVFYMAAVLLWFYGFFSMLGFGLWIIGFVGASAHLVWQISQMDVLSAKIARRLFVSNRTTGLILTTGLLVPHLGL